MLDALVGLLDDAVGGLAADGRIAPRNEAMRRLQIELGSQDAPISQWPMRAVDREALVAALGEPGPTRLCVAMLVDGCEHAYEVRFARAGDERMVLVRDRSGDDRVAERLLALERLRVAGELAPALVHDLNNALGTVLGFVDEVRGMAGNRADIEFLDVLSRAAADGGSKLRRFELLVGAMGQQRDRVAFGALVCDAIAMYEKSARRSGHCLRVEVPADLPEVEVAIGEFMHAFLAVVLHCRDSAEAGSELVIEARAQTRPAAAGGGRFAVVELRDLSMSAAAGGALVDAMEAAPGEFARVFLSADDAAMGVLVPLLSLRLAGGDWSYRIAECRREVRVALPALPEDSV